MSIPLKYNDVKNYIETNNYKLISEEYISNDKKLKIECNNNHIFYMTYNNFKKGRRCRFCNIDNRRLNFTDVINYIESFNYKYISGLYKNNSSKLKVQCPNGHIYDVRFHAFKNLNNRCKICKGLNKLTIDYVKTHIESFDYKLLSNDYIAANHKLKVECPNKHIYEVKWNDFQQGYRCKICYFELHVGDKHPKWNSNKNIVKELRRTTRKKWVEKHMTNDPLYNEYIKNSKMYHIDHIFPIRAGYDFLYKNNYLQEKKLILEMRKILNQKSNLRIILKEDNLNKKMCYNYDEFILFLKKNNFSKI